MKLTDIFKTKNGRSMLTVCFLAFASVMTYGQSVDFSVVSVPEEMGIEFRKITNVNDNVCLPEAKRSRDRIQWFSNRVLAMTPDGESIAYLSFRNDATNIFIKDLQKQGGSRQRTNRAGVIDFSYSPDGKDLYFSEQRGNTTQIFRTDANDGYVCRQITSGANDFSPTRIGDQVFFARQENNGCSIWSYSLKDNFLSNYTNGYNPAAVPGEKALVITRTTATGQTELWKINYETGAEECIVTDRDRSFTTPIISPDGQYIAFVGSSLLQGPGFTYPNTDIFVCRTDGTDLRQLTYHASNDFSPVWSKDGQYIYFVSQRGDAEGNANIWRMNFMR